MIVFIRLYKAFWGVFVTNINTSVMFFWCAPFRSATLINIFVVWGYCDISRGTALIGCQTGHYALYCSDPAETASCKKNINANGIGFNSKLLINR